MGGGEQLGVVAGGEAAAAAAAGDGQRGIGVGDRCGSGAGWSARSATWWENWGPAVAALGSRDRSTGSGMPA